MKTHDQLVAYMWKKYPDDEDLPYRTGMLECYHFMTGKVETKYIQELDLKLIKL